MKSRVVAVKTAPNKISIEFQNGTVWEYEKGEVSYTEWTLGKPTDWFIPNELDFLKKINRYLEEAIQYKNLTSWQKLSRNTWNKVSDDYVEALEKEFYRDGSTEFNGLSGILKDHQVDAAKYGTSYMVIGRRHGKSEVAAHMAKQKLLNKTISSNDPRVTHTGTGQYHVNLRPKQYLIVFPDDVSYVRNGPYLYTNIPNYKPNRIHQVNLSYPNQFKKFRGMTFDHVLFINCDESFLPPELQVTMYYAKLTYVK